MKAAERSHFIAKALRRPGCAVSLRLSRVAAVRCQQSQAQVVDEQEPPPVRPPKTGSSDVPFRLVKHETHPAMRTHASYKPSKQLAGCGNTVVALLKDAHHPKDTLAARLLVPRKELTVVYDSGEHRSFDPLHIRDSCSCHRCIDEHSGQRKFNTADIPEELSIRAAEQDEKGGVKVWWQNDIRGWSRQHFTFLPPAWFTRQLRPTSSFEISKVWNSASVKERLRPLSYDEYLGSTSGYHQALRSLNRLGLVIISGVPSGEDSIERIGEKIGPLRHTFYGRTCVVKDKPQAENVAYTSGHLGLHMDLLYMKQPPGLQLLHCINAAGEGGESLFSDSFHAARRIEFVNPDAFRTLANFQVPYHYTKGGHSFFDSKPVLELSRKEHPSTLTSTLLNVNWSPPFQGKFAGDGILKDRGRRLHEWHTAARAFAALIEDPEEALFKYRLKEGDCVIFNNRRVLHGRTAFTSDGGGAVRWLKGAYLDTDDFESQVRVMTDDKKLNQQVINGTKAQSAEHGDEGSGFSRSFQQLGRSFEENETEQKNP